MFKLLLNKKLLMLKIEYSSNDNRSVGVLCLHWKPLATKPRPKIQNPSTF